MRRCLLPLALLAGMACGDDPPSGDVEAWSVTSTPLASVGAFEGDSASLFQNVVDVEVAPTGELVVADAGLGVVRVYGPTGTFVTQMGGPGEGPGEFAWLRSIWIPGPDTVGVWDSRSARLTYFDLDGRLLNMVSLERTAEANGVGTLDLLVGSLPDGSVLVGTVGLSSRDRVGADRISVERFAPDGSHLGRVLETTGFVRDRLAERLTGPVAFSPRPMFALDDDRLYHTTGADPTVALWEDGEVDTVSTPAVRRDVGPAWEILGQRLAELDIELYDQALEQAPRPDSLPVLAGLLVDARGNVWVKEFDPATDALWLGAVNGTGGSWLVITPEGDLAGRVVLPSGFAPHVVTDSSVVGVHTDELGVQRVQVYGLDDGSR